MRDQIEGESRQIGVMGRVHALAVAMFCTAQTLLFASEAGAQCSARDVLQRQLGQRNDRATKAPPTPIRSALDVPVWKTIAIGTFADSFALTNALDAKGCAIGNLAAEAVARPAFSVSSSKREVDLVVVSAAELGFENDTASLADIRARAQQLGFGHAPAEVALQLRLQYVDQPVGEFLVMGMEPITTWKGQPIVLTIANGGAGLIVIGQDGSADAAIPVASRLLFLRPAGASPVDRPEQVKANLP